MLRNFNARFSLLIGMVLIAVLLRLLPHWPNFTPIAAMALFGGAHFSRRVEAFLVPLVAMFLSDCLLGFHGTMWAVYLSFVAIVALGIYVREQRSAFTIAGAAMTSSLLFFTVTNFAAWLNSGHFYSKTMAGLASCYIAALPFLGPTLAGDLFYTVLFFGVVKVCEQRFTVFKSAAY